MVQDFSYYYVTSWIICRWVFINCYCIQFGWWLLIWGSKWSLILTTLAWESIKLWNKAIWRFFYFVVLSQGKNYGTECLHKDIELIHSLCRESINIMISGPKSKPLNQVNKIKIIWVNKNLDFSKVPRSEFQENRVYKYWGQQREFCH